MESLLKDILDTLRTTGQVDGRTLERLIRDHNHGIADNADHYSKKRLMAYYLQERETDTGLRERLGIDDALEQQLLQVLRVKPRRTASGVATVTVLTKPWTCSSQCLYCPNDTRMPKSYLHDEPACQRAERNFFDPYLQVIARLRALTRMGHVTDKVELIVLGGTWTDYPEAYRIWFVKELFRALNEFLPGSDAERDICAARQACYREHGIENDRGILARFVQDDQQKILSGNENFNDAWRHLYGPETAWGDIASLQAATYDELFVQHTANEQARHRVVGLVVETRPDTLSCEALTSLRRLGCTKVQMGIQSLDPAILAANNRTVNLPAIQRAIALTRLFGFKVHVHFMMNLYGATRPSDKRDYHRLVADPAYMPDEVKLYPCALVEGTGLCTHYEDGTWKPYSEDELVDVLAAAMIDTPPYVRISRMIRDISAHDILVGNKKINLRQMVEAHLTDAGAETQEMRSREIGTDDIDVTQLELQEVPFETAVTNERFLQWVTPDNRLAGFLRLSLPHPQALKDYPGIPLTEGDAMIREVHVYGKVASLNRAGDDAQHLGLGKQLVQRACSIAREQNYTRIGVISSVGTREYYRNLGFSDNTLYQWKVL